jgi:predicted O-methyltransferase YrrM
MEWRTAGMKIKKRLKRLKQEMGLYLNGGVQFQQCLYGKNHHQVPIQRSDISDHLGSLFFHVASNQPKLIVELGTRGGESTKVLVQVAEMFDAQVLSIDIDDCSNVQVPDSPRWHFVQSDDIIFGQSRFSQWCADHNLPAQADVIFIDTSHLYEHTQQEIATWIPHLTPQGAMMFHDTNMGTGVFHRLDGSLEFGWDNDRGVIRAVEEFLGVRYNEGQFISELCGEFLVRHYPNCNGFTVLQRVKATSQTARRAA